MHAQAQSWVPHFAQRDTQWNTERLGMPGSGLTIGNQGCGVASSAMVLNYYGIALTPLELNNNLVENKGFSGALLYWGKTEAWNKATDGKVKAMSVTGYSEDTLKRNLDHGRPVIVYLGGRHYVVVVDYEEVQDRNNPGTTQTRYRINDPWLSEDYGLYIPFEQNAIGLRPGNITQMIVIHTDVPLSDPNLPPVDWPALQEKYAAMGSVESWLGKPTADDIYTTDRFGFVKIHTQVFEYGKLYGYQVGSDSPWQVFALPSVLARAYDAQDGLLGEWGRLTYDAYKFHLEYDPGRWIWRVDLPQASLLADPEGGEVEIYQAGDGYLAEYYANPELSGSPAVTRFEPRVQFDWGLAAPHPELQPEAYSIRFRQTFTIQIPWLQSFYVWPHGGARLYLDGQLILDEWQATAAAEYSTLRYVGRGEHEWVVEYRHTGGEAGIYAAFVEWPVKIAWADEATYAGFERLPDTAPPLEGEPLPLPEPAPAPQGSTVLDDTASAFTRLGSPELWQQAAGGYGGNFYYLSAGDQERAYGNWQLVLPQAGKYTLYVYVPAEHATASGAQYRLSHAGSQETITVNLYQHLGEWYHLGEFAFTAEGEEFLQLSNWVLHSAEGAEVAFDAIAYQYQEPPIFEGLWETLLSKVQIWWEEFSREIAAQIEAWWQEQSAELQRELERWINEELDQLLRQFEREFLAWLEQQCGSVYLLISLPLAALVLHRRRL